MRLLMSQELRGEDPFSHSELPRLRRHLARDKKLAQVLESHWEDAVKGMTFWSSEDLLLAMVFEEMIPHIQQYYDGLGPNMVKLIGEETTKRIDGVLTRKMEKRERLLSPGVDPEIVLLKRLLSAID